MKYFILFACLCSSTILSAQSDTTKIKLPFAISAEKRLDDDDLKNKKEGTYVTGIPDFSSDPINGFGYGGEASIFFNGKKSDPFFAYTPYRAELGITVFNTSKQQRELAVRLDIPYIFNSKWRLRVETGYESNPNLLYFGIDEASSLKGLNNPSSPNNNESLSYQDYANKYLVGDYENFNIYNKQEFHLNTSMEKSYLEGKLRVLGGLEFAYVNMSTFGGYSLLANDYSTNKIVGDGSQIVTFVQAGLIYDTRDLEADPNRGLFIELNNELSLKALGSKYNFNKTFFHLSYYKSLFPGVFKKLIFASRISMGYTAGDAPFYEYQDQWSSEGSIEGLGGANTLRGYKQSRFLGRVMTFNNFELRYRFAEASILKQHFGFSLVPFFDIGGVWDNFSSFFKNSQNYRYSQGLGFRIAWNVNTILRFDYAISKEDKQFFFNLAHAF